MSEPERDPPRRERTARPSALFYVVPAALYVGYIFVMGTAKDPEAPLNVSDKTAHFAAFGFMVPLLMRALRYFVPAAPRARVLLVSAALSSLAGALLELWQSFLPYRTAELLDWVADTAGASLALALVALVWRLNPRGAESRVGLGEDKG
jgi:VanZ family protein